MRTLLRVLLAFLAASIAGGLVQVLFASPPTGLGADGAPVGEKLAGLLALTAMVATQLATFALPFWLVAIAIAEWLGLRSWIYYALTGIAIAVAGFMVLHMGEGPARTFLHDYALRAFLTTGLVSGLTYWIFGGRSAGGPAFDIDEDPAEPALRTK
jgi:hypothetical protein